MKRRSLIFAACALAITPAMAAQNPTTDEQAFKIIGMLYMDAMMIQSANNIYDMCGDMSCRQNAERDIDKATNAFKTDRAKAKKIYRKLNSNAKKKAFMDAVKACEAAVTDKNINVDPYITALEMELDI